MVFVMFPGRHLALAMMFAITLPIIIYMIKTVLPYGYLCGNPVDQ